MLRLVAVMLTACFLLPFPAVAQDSRTTPSPQPGAPAAPAVSQTAPVSAPQQDSPVQTRAGEIAQARRDKQARLWPERESPLVQAVNRLVERGMGGGLRDGRGKNGLQFLLGGMRSGQGAAFGVGYRRTDLWRERLGFRSTARGTFQQAVMWDADLDFQSLRTERSFVRLYTRYERSPHMDFYGLGPFSRQQDQTRFKLEDFAVDADAGIKLSRDWRVGFTAGGVTVNARLPEEVTVPASSQAPPGLGEQTDYARWGGFLLFDSRDWPAGPKSGSLLGARFRRYDDRSSGQYSFRQAEFEVQHYLPYFNKSRVVALRASVVLSFEDSGSLVPIYFMPTVGGNDNLRSFARYRFYDNHAIRLSGEHRWYVFRGLDMAAFVDAGKVIPRKADLNFSDLDYSGGIGFRTRFNEMVVMRNDFAWGREGFRWMWTFSDVFKTRY